jgi:hypothetical protein
VESELEPKLNTQIVMIIIFCTFILGTCFWNGIKNKDICEAGLALVLALIYNVLLLSAWNRLEKRQKDLLNKNANLVDEVRRLEKAQK